jgi:TRAP-type C4-dicarboxylate transport system permease small subunit
MILFGKLLDLIERIQIFLGILCLCLIAGIIPLQVFFRYVVNKPLLWPEDIAKGLLVWLGFMGAAVLHKHRGLVTVDFFLNMFGYRTASAISFILDVMIAVLIVLLIVYGYRLNLLQMMSLSSLTEIPRGYFFSMPLVVNSAVMLLYSLYGILQKAISVAG